MTFNLEITKSNLFDFYNLHNTTKNSNKSNTTTTYPSYFVENNGLILSIVSNEHIEKLRTLNLSITKVIKILERRLYHRDLFTVYLSDTNFRTINNNIKYPIGEIITKINNKKFTSYDEFIDIIKNPIKSIKTIDNDIFII